MRLKSIENKALFDSIDARNKEEERKERDRQAIKRKLEKARFQAAREAEATEMARAQDRHVSNVALFEQTDKLANEQRIAELDRIAIKRDLDASQFEKNRDEEEREAAREALLIEEHDAFTAAQKVRLAEDALKQASYDAQQREFTKQRIQLHAEEKVS